MARLASLAGDLPVIVTGDLNADPRSAPYRIFTRDTIAGGIGPLVDAFDASRSGHYGPTSSWNAFKAIEAGRRTSPGHPLVRAIASSRIEAARSGRVPAEISIGACSGAEVK